MIVKRIFRFYLFIVSVVAITACSSVSEEDREKLEEASIDLQKLADQIIITYPANQSVVTTSITAIRADVPSDANVTSLKFFVDGVEIGADNDGAPWEFSWDSYYWGDGNAHTILVKAELDSGVEVRNNTPHQVTVSTSANTALGFESSISGLILKDTSSVLVELSQISGAVNYEIELNSGSGIDLNTVSTSEILLSNLMLGEYSIRYRAQTMLQDSVVVTGPWSEPVSFIVAPPDAPVVNSPTVTSNGGLYEIGLSWGTIAEGDSYNIYFSRKNGDQAPTLYSTQTENELVINDVDLGIYVWQVERTNQFGHVSAKSEIGEIEVGVFTRKFGGSSDDTARKIVRSSMGDYIVLATTKSADLFPAVDSAGDDWVFKLGGNGELVWQYFSGATGKPRFKKFIVDSDENIILVGADQETGEAIVTKLSPSGLKVWEDTFSPESAEKNYSYESVIEYAGEIFAIGSELGGTSICPGCMDQQNQALVKINSQTGQVDSVTELTLEPGLQFLHITGLYVDADNNLIVYGIAEPESSTEYFDEGAFIQVLNEDLVVQSEWNNVGEYDHVGVSDFYQLSNGAFRVIGHLMDFETVVSYVDPGISADTKYLYYEEGTLDTAITAEGDNIILVTIDIVDDGRDYTFFSLDSSLNTTKKSALDPFIPYSSLEDAVYNPAGTITLLFTQSEQSWGNQKDLLITTFSP